MIKNTEILSMAESSEYLDKKSESELKVINFIKKFTELKPKEAKEIRSKLEELGNVKLNSEKIVKIIDLLPENNEELNRIFNDISLDEDESKKIVDIVKQFK